MSVCLLLDKAVRQFMLQDPRQLLVHRGQSLHRHANAAVIQRARPSGSLGYVRKRFLRVQDHADGIRRRIVQCGFDGGKVHLQRAQDIPRQCRRGCSAVTQSKMAALVFLVTLFFLLVALRLVQGRSHLRIRPQGERLLPFRDGLVQLAHAVVSPALEFCDIRIVGSHAPRAFQVFERLFVFAPAKMDVGHVHQQRRLFRGVDQRGALVGQGVFQIAV